MKKKVTVTITLEIDPNDYPPKYSGEDAEYSAVEIVKEMLYGCADIPYQACLIKCGKFIKPATI
jgi:hypothetical protein